MARYRLNRAAYFDNPIRVYKPFDLKIESVHLDEGAEIEFQGVPGEHMEPLDAEARKAFELAAKDRAKWDQHSLDAQRLAILPQAPIPANIMPANPLPPSGR